jgi:hypothetical protein
VETIGSAHDEFLQATGKALFLNKDQISGALSSSS